MPLLLDMYVLTFLFEVQNMISMFFFFFFVAVITDYDYVFAENGLVAYKNGELIGTQVIFICILKQIFAVGVTSRLVCMLFE